MSTPISIVGNLTADPELRFTKSGKAVAKLRVAVSERVKEDGAWKDGEPTFWKVTVWGGLAEHVGDSLAKGSRIIAVGRVSSSTWETKEGEKAPTTRSPPRRADRTSCGPRQRSRRPARAGLCASDR